MKLLLYNIIETLALKGLFLCNLGRKEEGHAEVKRGVKNNIRSYICKLIIIL